MSTVAVGSLWQKKEYPTTTVKVIHTLDYTEIDKDKQRYIIFEQFHRTSVGQIRDIGLGVHVLPKSQFTEKYERPPVLIPEDTP